MTMAVRATAEKNTFGHLAQRVAMRRQSLRRPNMISLRRLYLRLSYRTGWSCDFRPGMQARMPLSFKASRARGERADRGHHCGCRRAGARGDLKAHKGGAGRRQGARRSARQSNGAAALGRAGRGGAPLREAVARNADRHAEDLRAVVEDVRAGGATSLRAIAGEMNARGILTPRGGRWHVSTVMNLLKRLEA
jgi:hypothetical protein